MEDYKCEYCGESVKQELKKGVINDVVCKKCKAEFQLLPF